MIKEIIDMGSISPNTSRGGGLLSKLKSKNKKIMNKHEETTAANRLAAKYEGNTPLVGIVVQRTALIAALNNLQEGDILISTQQSDVEGAGACGMLELNDGKSVIQFFNKEFIDWVEQQQKLTRPDVDVTVADTAQQITWDRTTEATRRVDE